MKRNLLFTIIFLLVLAVTSCDTVDKKVPEIATDICNCFTSANKNMSADLKTVLIKSGEADKPQETFNAQLLPFNPAKRDSMISEWQRISTIGSEVYQCMQDFQKKYGGGKTKDRDKFYENLFAEMKTRSGCELALAAMKLSYKETTK